MTDLRQLLASNMKIYRNLYGLSQSKLADKVDTATNYIAAIEAGRRFPSVEMLEKIAAALEVDPPELFSIKSIQINTAKKEFEELVWLNVGQNLSNYIAERLQELKKS